MIGGAIVVEEFLNVHLRFTFLISETLDIDRSLFHFKLFLGSVTIKGLDPLDLLLSIITSDFQETTVFEGLNNGGVWLEVSHALEAMYVGDIDREILLRLCLFQQMGVLEQVGI